MPAPPFQASDDYFATSENFGAHYAEPAKLDIISAIDHVTGCQQCGNPLGPSPSDDFCGEGCQQAWAAKRVAPKVQQRPAPEGTRPAFHLLNAVVYRSDGEQWVEFGQVNGQLEAVAHFDISLSGDVVDNTDALRARANSNSNIRGWIAPEVWEYLREGEGS